MKIKTISIFFAIAGLLGSMVWLKYESGWEPVTAILASVTLLMGLLVSSGDKENGKPNMKQKGGKIRQIINREKIST